jgi:RNA polymerase sigma-70 factor (ECF subfamily)
LYRFALLRLRDAQKAEEVVQDTLVAALQARERFNGGASVCNRLIGILKHKIMDRFRRDAREAPPQSADLVSAEDELFAEEDFFDSKGSWRKGSRLGQTSATTATSCR